MIDKDTFAPNSHYVADKMMETIKRLVETAITESHGPVDCYTTLHMAARSYALSLAASDAPLHDRAADYCNDILRDVDHEALGALAKDVLAKQIPVLISDDAMKLLSERATAAVRALAGGDFFDALVTLHLASLMVIQVLESRHTQEEMVELMDRLTNVRRTLSNVKFEVMQVTLSKGGQA